MGHIRTIKACTNYRHQITIRRLQHAHGLNEEVNNDKMPRLFEQMS